MSNMKYKHIFGFTATILHCIYIYIYKLFIFVERNTVDTGESSKSSNPTAPAQRLRGVEDSCNILFIISLINLNVCY